MYQISSLINSVVNYLMLYLIVILLSNLCFFKLFGYVNWAKHESDMNDDDYVCGL